MCLFWSLSLALDLCRPFPRWASLACSLLSLFLCLSLALYSKFVDKTINLSLIFYTTRIKKQFSLSVFVFIDYLVVSTLQDTGGYAISRQNKLELYLGCHTCWLSYFPLVCLWYGLKVGRATVRLRITKFSRMGRSALNPIGRSPFLSSWNLHKVELFSDIISHLRDISSWKCSWKCKSLQFERKKIWHERQ